MSQQEVPILQIAYQMGPMEQVFAIPKQVEEVDFVPCLDQKHS